MKWVIAFVALLIGLFGGFFLSSGDSETEAAGGGSFLKSLSSPTPSAKRMEPGSGSSASKKALDTKTSSPEGAITSEWLKTLSDLDAFDQIGALHARLKEIDPSEFSTVMDEMGLEMGNALSWQVRSMIAARWAQVDPQGMLDYANTQKGVFSWSLNSVIFGAWAKQDVQAAYSAAMQLNSRRSKDAALQAIINTVAMEQPQRAIEMARDYYGNDIGGRGRWVFQSIYRNWAQKDGEAARQSALAMEEGSSKSAALSGAMSEWMANDPVEALAWLDSLPMDSAVYGSRKEVFRNFLNQDFEVAKEYIESVQDPLDKRQILESLQFHNLAWQKSYEEIEEVFDWLGTVATGQVYDNRVSSIITAMVENDSSRAIDFVLNMRPGNARMNGLNSIGSKLVEIDPKMAFEFVDSLPYEDEKRRALGSMGWRLSQQGVESASALIANNEDPLVQRQLASRISGEWSNYDQASALAWSESLTDEQARKSAVRSVLKNMIESDPAAALSYIESSMEESDHGSVLRDAFSNWARNDPQAAVSWLDRLPESVSESQGNIYRSVTSSFISHDPMAASEWIATLEESPERDQSVEALVNNISKSDPEAGFIWAVTVSDVEKRKSILSRSVQQWVKTDPDAAYKAIADAKIEATEKEPLLKMLEGKL